eukprot:scaffold11036_cov120-Isochrysis_galbana.AAC.3
MSPLFFVFFSSCTHPIECSPAPTTGSPRPCTGSQAPAQAPVEQPRPSGETTQFHCEPSLIERSHVDILVWLLPAAAQHARLADP